ncbi:MAG TPA: MerR family transcriptional regulator [Clostridia bacterium]|nr:MerR family transcriptional regulator [Clostridia bacterium]
MDNLVKIREVSLKYDVSTRTLRYYEDMGLLQSVKNEDYAYRMYDENSMKRLEQILILRKLNISIKDIQKIFQSQNSEVLLQILSKKVTDIDEEVALLHELKEIVLDFIKQIEKLDFHMENDIKLLYEKARVIEQKLTMDSYNGNPASANNLAAVAEKLKKRPDVRIVELPACKMATSGVSKDPSPFDEEGLLMRFDKWWSELDKQRKDKFFPRDFMWYDEEKGGLVWNYALSEGLPYTGEYDVLDFEGGLYAAAVSKDGDDEDGQRVHVGIMDWVNESGYFETDIHPGRYTMFHVITSPVAGKAMGYGQLEIYVPIKIR